MIFAAILAAGSGSRMNSKISKQYLNLSGKPIFIYSLQAVINYGGFDDIIVAVGNKDISYVENIIKDYTDKKITVIVNRGMADDVMDIARESGARGGTILHGKGTGTKNAAKLFGMEVEPEKELVLIIVPTEIEEKVVKNLYDNLEMQNSGNGILFVEDITDVRGIVL